LPAAMSNLRILVVSERYWPDGRGAELATHLIIEILSRRYDITVVTGSINIHKVPNVSYVFEPLLSKRSRPILWLNLLKLVKIQRFQKLLREHDVIYIPRFALPLIPYAKRENRKVIVHLHDYVLISNAMAILAPFEEHKCRILEDDLKLLCIESFGYCIGAHLFWWMPKLAKKWILQADKVVCVSKRQAEIITDRIPELRDRVEVVYNPLPSELVVNELKKELDNTPTFLYVNGDSYVKGFHVLLQAMKQLGKQGAKIRFILAGRYSLESLSALRRLSEIYRNLEIEVMGRVEYSKLPELHQKAWALVFPSICEEPLPYAVVEAMVLGTIPIASKIGGVIEIIEGCDAIKFTFRPSNVVEVVEKIKVVSSLDKQDLEKLGDELRKIVLQRFYSGSLNKKLLKVFSFQ